MKKFLAGIFFLLSGLSPIEVPAASSFYDHVNNVTRYCQQDNCSSCSGIEAEEAYLFQMVNCHSCMPGYHLVEFVFEGELVGKCERDTPVCPSNCSSCSDSSTCTSCYSGYTLSNGKCISGSESESEGGMVSCPVGQYLSGKKCVDCSTIPVQNGTCSACSSDGTCTNATCDKGYAYNASTSACTPVVTCKPPLKFSADYSGDCDGCCVE